MLQLTHAIVSYESTGSASPTALEPDPNTMSCSDVAGNVSSTVHTNHWPYCTLSSKFYIVLIAEFTCLKLKLTEAHQHTITCKERMVPLQLNKNRKGVYIKS